VLISTRALIPHDSTNQKSSVVEEAHIYGCFSSCGSPCLPSRLDVLAGNECEGMDGILALVLHAPEPHELCGNLYGAFVGVGHI
jgi:hypothetical protein